MGAIIGTLATIALFEGVAALLEHMEGDPEADVMSALKGLAARNQRRAFAQTAVEESGRADIEEKFSRFNEVPQRLLTREALGRMPGPPIGGSNTGLLDMVASKLGVHPSSLETMSHPSRIGDMSGIMRQMGQPTH